MKIRIDDREELIYICTELNKIGLLDNVDISKLSNTTSLPVEIPVEVNSVLKLVKNPIVKPFRKTIASTLTVGITAALAK